MSAIHQRRQCRDKTRRDPPPRHRCRLRTQGPERNKATSPRVVVEVLSPTTRDFDTIGKLDEYRLIESLERIVVVEPNAPEVIVWARGVDRSWRKAIRRGLDQEIDMPEIGATLALAEIYDGVEFPARPRLVAEEVTSAETASKSE